MSRRRGTPDEGLNVLSRRDVEAIVREFGRLNPFDRRIVPDLLKIEKVNRDERGRFRELLGFAISAKRYVLYDRRGRRIRIIEPKAHGLGYLYPPTSRRDWHASAWKWMLADTLGLPASSPAWCDRPALMRVVLSTPNVLRQATRKIRPFNFLFYVLVDGSVSGPQGTDPDRFTLIAPFTKDRSEWLKLPCLNVYDGQVYRLALNQSPALDKVIPQTFGAVLRRYRDHPEAKSLRPDGSRCDIGTQGLLSRDRVVAGAFQPIGKEADRRWQHGEDLSLIESKILHYRIPKQTVKADRALARRIAAVGMRESMRRSGLSQHTLEKIQAGCAVRPRTLQRLLEALDRDGQTLVKE